MYDKPLPVGSIVLLKEANKRLMILGYLKYGKENKTDIYDYAACLYPEGFISPEQTFIFNHDQIQTIFALGYQDSKQKAFTGRLIKQFNQLKGEAYF